MRQGTVFQFRIDLLDDRVPAVDLISSDSVETIPVDGGEKRVVPVQVEQGILPTRAFGLVEFRDAADHQTREWAGSLVRLVPVPRVLDRKSPRLTPVTFRARMPHSA